MTPKWATLGALPNGGINNAQGQMNVEDNEAADAQNVRFWLDDVIQRGGYSGYLMSGGSPLAIAAAPVTGIHTATYSNGVQLTVFSAGTLLVKDNGTSFTNVKTGLTSNANNLATFCEINDVTIFSNGVDALFKFSDTVAATALSGTPPATAVAMMAFLNRIIVGNGSTVQWCTINNPDDWVSVQAGSAQPALKTGQNITALASVGTEAFVFYDSMVWQMHPTGDSNAPFQFTLKDPIVGASGQASVIAIPELSTIFFVGKAGIYQMSQQNGYVPQRISKKIDGTWATVNKTRLKYISAALYPHFNEVWFTASLTGSSQNSFVMAYDYERSTWTIFNIPCNIVGNWKDGLGETRMLHGDYTGHPFINESGTNDNGAAIDAYVTSKAFALVDGTKRARVTCIDLHLLAQVGSSLVELNYGYDLQGPSIFTQVQQGIAGAQWDDAQFDVDEFPATGFVKPRIWTKGIGTHFQYQIRQRQLNQTFRLYHAFLAVMPARRGEQR